MVTDSQIDMPITGLTIGVTIMGTLIEIVHLGKSSKDDCSLFIQTRKKTHKALWDSGACKCVLSLESYQMIPDKYKTDLFSSNIKIKAANGTIIKNNGE